MRSVFEKNKREKLQCRTLYIIMEDKQCRIVQNIQYSTKLSSRILRPNY